MMYNVIIFILIVWGFFVQIEVMSKKLVFWYYDSFLIADYNYFPRLYDLEN